jgi:hypothetical protein
VLVIAGLADKPNGGVIGRGTGRIQGPATGLLQPKGLSIAFDTLLVSDVGDKQIRGFPLGASGDVAPAFVVTNLGADRAAWDTEYDAAGDRLYAACTDGAVLVYDAFSVNEGAAGPTRTILPMNSGFRLGFNLHGIAYSASTDTLILSDVLDLANPGDGRVFTIANASRVNGDTDARARIEGANTLLGNPTAIAFDGESLYVADKLNDKLLRFDGILEKTGRLDVRPDASTTVANAESVALMPTQ